MVLIGIDPYPYPNESQWYFPNYGSILYRNPWHLVHRRWIFRSSPAPRPRQRPWNRGRSRLLPPRAVPDVGGRKRRCRDKRATGRGVSWGNDGEMMGEWWMNVDDMGINVVDCSCVSCLKGQLKPEIPWNPRRIHGKIQAWIEHLSRNNNSKLKIESAAEKSLLRFLGWLKCCTRRSSVRVNALLTAHRPRSRINVVETVETSNLRRYPWDPSPLLPLAAISSNSIRVHGSLLTPSQLIEASKLPSPETWSIGPTFSMPSYLGFAKARAVAFASEYLLNCTSQSLQLPFHISASAVQWALVAMALIWRSSSLSPQPSAMAFLLKLQMCQDSCKKPALWPKRKFLPWNLPCSGL